MPAPPGPVPPPFPADPAQGVFETLLVFEGRPVELDAHLARMKASVRSLFDAEIDREAEELLVNEAAPIRLGRIRLTARPRADGGRDHRTDSIGSRWSLAGGLMLAVRTAEVEPSTVFPAAEHAVRLRTVAVPGGLGPHKWVDRSLLERLDEGDPLDEGVEGVPPGEGASLGEGLSLDEGVPLLVDSDGAALEASRANLFAVRDGVLKTPALDGRILPGVTRSRVLDIAGTAGLEIRETGLDAASLIEASEIFLTGAVRGVEPVRSLDGTELQTKGDVTQRVARELRRRWFG